MVLTLLRMLGINHTDIMTRLDCDFLNHAVESMTLFVFNCSMANLSRAGLDLPLGSLQLVSLIFLCLCSPIGKESYL